MRCKHVAVGLALIASFGPLAAQAAAPPQRVGAPVTQVPVPEPVDVAQATKTKAVARPTNPVAIEQAQKDRINAWTVGWPPGRIEGAPLLFASELARVLDDGDNMRVLPIVTRGPFDNVYDLLYLRGVDAGHRLRRRARPLQGQARVRRRLAAHQLSAQPVPVRGAPLRAARDQLAAGPRRQGGQLQSAGHRRRLFRPDHLQAARHRHRGDVHAAQRSHGEDEARAPRSPPPSGSRPSRCRSS